jgi:hypothetical protein
VDPVAGYPVGVVAKGEKGRNVPISDEPDVSATTTVTAVGATHRNRSFSTERDTACSPISCAHIQLAFIDELAHEHSSACTLSVRTLP